MSIEAKGLFARSSRRRFLENAAIIGGGLAVTTSGVDSLISASQVFDKVAEERPYILIDDVRIHLNIVRDRLKNLSRTPAQQQILNQTESILTFDASNEAAREQRAKDLQAESDQTPVLGIERKDLRWEAAGVGGTTMILGIVSKVFRFVR